MQDKKITRVDLMALGFVDCENADELSFQGNQYDYCYVLGDGDIKIRFSERNYNCHLAIQSYWMTGDWYAISLNELKGIIYFAFKPELLEGFPNKEIFKPIV